jgi:hypothetical protein
MDLFPSSGRRVGSSILFDLLDRARLSSWTTYIRITSSMYLSEIRFHKLETTGAFTVKTVEIYKKTRNLS